MVGTVITEPTLQGVEATGVIGTVGNVIYVNFGGVSAVSATGGVGWEPGAQPQGTYATGQVGVLIGLTRNGFELLCHIGTSASMYSVVTGNLPITAQIYGMYPLIFIPIEDKIALRA